ncbi:hypothetical protein ACN1C3_30210 [Pseudomonas sp. H11T01]|uniref:hypothetical protein n=1 Tax=Pseudomonas sp. H11T01 TaxID=3402749 RepID=UPI003AD63D9F
MRNPNYILVAAKALRDNLVLTGANPVLLAKLNSIVDDEHIGVIGMTRLKRLIAQAERS